MRIASFEREGRRFAGQVEDGESVRAYRDEPPLGPATDFQRLASRRAEGPEWPLSEVRLLPVVPAPEKIVCLGLNYRGHAEEAGYEPPAYPALFTKFADCLTGPFAPIRLPPESRMVDFEAELAVVIGRPARRLGAADALAAVAGYAVANDVSMRDFQRRSNQWLQGKTWPATTPLGPWLVTVDELGDAAGLDIRLLLGDLVPQQANTAQMIFDVPRAVSIVSEFTPLGPGDVILMGTPEGVGARLDPPRFLRAGDRVRVEIEGIGAIENRVVEE